MKVTRYKFILPLTIIVLFAVIGVSGAFLRPDKTKNANLQLVEMARLKPSFWEYKESRDGN